ncbi:LamG domain-containing protein [Streptomyces deccanensis]|uniref:LamG domain-containing protein n=1 Tax=Streptomyces deccanensis TaxID=424188 RepID=UPI001EFAACE2|nr:LamG domain-containing protein [Streptomyces deccanensis]ULR52981.1 LamG domain-containing protein [Streptomyces deccanensis]
MNALRKAAAVLSAAAAILIAIPPTASATPAPHQTYDGTLVRENFNRLPLGPVTRGRGWTTDTSNGTLTVEPSADGRGRELSIRTEGNGRAFFVLSDLAPPGNSFWARMRLRVAEFPTAPDWAHWTLAEASGPDSPTLVRPIGGQYAPTDKGNFWGVGSDLGPTGDWTDWRTSAPAVSGKWQCVEFHLDATDNRVTVYLDGVAQSDLTVSTQQHGGTADDFVFPTFDKLKLGWQLYQANPSPSSYDVRLDDIALSTRRVGGCGG